MKWLWRSGGFKEAPTTTRLSSHWRPADATKDGDRRGSPAEWQRGGDTNRFEFRAQAEEETLQISCYFMLLKPDRSERSWGGGGERRCPETAAGEIWTWIAVKVRDEGLCGIKTGLAAVNDPWGDTESHWNTNTTSLFLCVCLQRNTETRGARSLLPEGGS